MSKNVEPGARFEAPYPFKRETFQCLDEDGFAPAPTWNPGITFEDAGPEDVEAFADAMGAVLYEVVSIHKPGQRFPTRVFYLRRWRTPDGHEFGKRKLRCTTMANFRTLLKGYRHEFTLEPADVRRERERAHRERSKEILASVGLPF